MYVLKVSINGVQMYLLNPNDCHQSCHMSFHWKENILIGLPPMSRMDTTLTRPVNDLLEIIDPKRIFKVIRARITTWACYFEIKFPFSCFCKRDVSFHVDRVECHALVFPMSPGGGFLFFLWRIIAISLSLYKWKGCNKNSVNFCYIF